MCGYDMRTDFTTRWRGDGNSHLGFTRILGDDPKLLQTVDGGGYR